jgi:shikimate dehydrogenase
MDEVDYVSGETRLFGIVGHPIEQVRSPEMITAELTRRGRNAILVPIDVLPDDFEACLAQLMRVRNLDGLVFTIPYKQAACRLASRLGEQALAVGAINALARDRDGGWIGEIFDGLGCVEAFRRAGHAFTDRRVMLIGAGGAGRAIAFAVASEKPKSLRIFDIDANRASGLAESIRAIHPEVDARFGEPTVEGVDILMNASPVGMLNDPRMPIEVAKIPSDVVVFDAIVKPEQTRLLTLARESGCRTIFGRQMMHGQIGKVVDHFERHNGTGSARPATAGA